MSDHTRSRGVCIMNQKKQGFTLIELLAVVVILAVVAIITTPIILNTIEQIKRESFLASARNVLHIAELYEAEENTIPKEGISVQALDMKQKENYQGYVFVDDGDYILKSFTDGKYCVNGTRSELAITKGPCEESSPFPTVTLQVKATTNQITVFTTAIDSSGISEYQYCFSDCQIESSWKVGEAEYTFSSLTHGTSYTIFVRVKNRLGGVTEKSIKTKTESLPTATYEITPSGWAVSKTVTISYPSGYQNYYKISEGTVHANGRNLPIGQWLSANDTISLQFTSSGRMVAMVSDGVNEVTTSDLVISQIDAEVPTCSLSVTSGTLGSNNWYTSAPIISMTMTDNQEIQGFGLGESATPFYDSTATTYTVQDGTPTIYGYVKDLAGNVNQCKLNVKVDQKGPTIALNNALPSSIAKGNSYAVFGKVTYSTSGGSYSCTPANTSSLAVGSQTVSCTATGNNGKTAKATKTITVVASSYTYAYTGKVQTFTAPLAGTYKIELWGAQGGSAWLTDEVDATGGKGAYVSGQIVLKKGEVLYVYVGQKGYRAALNASRPYAFNGGAPTGDGNWGNNGNGGSGGGATDIRLVNGAWDNFDSLKSRIMVAAGGGGAGYHGANGGAGGTLNGVRSNNGSISYNGGAPSQIAPGTGVGDGNSASFGRGGAGGPSYAQNMYSAGGGGGGGYYGGGGGGSCYYSSGYSGGGAGGSSFISGYTGCNAITSASTASSIKHSGTTVHYSGKKFTSGTMTAGNRSGNGSAKITFVK